MAMLAELTEVEESATRKAERAVCGAILSGCPVEEVAAVVSSQDFYEQACRDVFLEAEEITREGGKADLVILAAKLPHRAAFLVECLEACGLSSQGPHYAKEVRKFAVKRAYRSVAGEILTLTRELPDAAALQGEIEKLVLSVSATRGATGAPHQLHDLVKKAVSDLDVPLPGGMLGIPTGFKKLSYLTNGFQAGRLYVIVGRPGHGKTSKAFCHGLHAASRGHWTHGFWLEMPSEETAIRALANLSAFDSNVIARRQISSQGLELALQAANIPFTFDFELFDFDQILSRARNLAKQGVKLFLFDYLLLFESRHRFERDDLRLGYFTRELKQFAKTTKTAVICLTQYTKENEEALPTRGDIYGSSKIINDADVIELLYNPVTIGEVDNLQQFWDEEKSTGLMRGLVVKNRGGKEGRIDYRFERATTTYRDWDGPEPKKETLR